MQPAPTPAPVEVVLDTSPSTAEWIAAAGSLLAALTAVVLIFLAYRQMRAANDQAQAARAQLRRLQEEERERAAAREKALERHFNEWMEDFTRSNRAERPFRLQADALAGLERAVVDLTAAVRGEPQDDGDESPPGTPR